MGQRKTKIIGEQSEPKPDKKYSKPHSEQEMRQAEKAKKIAQIAQDAKNAQIEDSTSETIEQTPAIKRVERLERRPKIGQTREKSARYKSALKLVDRKKQYLLNEAIEIVKKSSYSKFDGTIELHIKTIVKKGQDPIRGLVTLPGGAVKSPKVAVASEELLQEIEKGKFDFNVLLSTPEMMPKLAKVAKILGPKGLMPSPKAGTVVQDPTKAMEEIAKGRVEIRQDAQGNIHIAVGKVSWESEKLKQNIAVVLRAVPAPRLDRVSLSATMGPGVRLAKV